FAADGLTVLEVERRPFNYVLETAKGVDIEAAYRIPAWGGDVMLRALATRYLERTTDDGITALRDTVGENVGSGPPKWRWNLKASYSRDPVNVALTARGISSGVYDNRFIECTQF